MVMLRFLQECFTHRHLSLVFMSYRPQQGLGGIQPRLQPGDIAPHNALGKVAIWQLSPFHLNASHGYISSAVYLISLCKINVTALHRLIFGFQFLFMCQLHNMSFLGETWKSKYSTGRPWGQAKEMIQLSLSSWINEFTGVTYRSMGGTKAATSPKSLPQCEWQLRKAASLALPEQLEGSSTEEFPLAQPLLIAHTPAERGLTTSWVLETSLGPLWVFLSHSLLPSTRGILQSGWNSYKINNNTTTFTVQGYKMLACLHLWEKMLERRPLLVVCVWDGAGAENGFCVTKGWNHTHFLLRTCRWWMCSLNVELTKEILSSLRDSYLPSVFTAVQLHSAV
jgi:hypothetical protein